MMRTLLILALLLTSFNARAQDVTIFAAASLTDALRDVSAAWTRAGHKPLRLSFGASSALARQIEQGAPAHVFASADTKWMDYVAGKDLIAVDTRRNLLGNDLVLIVPGDRARRIEIDARLDLRAIAGPDGRIATGDPTHVPVGLYARQALTTLGLWNAVAPRLARTDDVRAALLLVERGEAAAGIVYATDAAASARVAVAGTFPAATHDPIVYPFAVTRSGDTPDARAVMAFLSGPEARAIFVPRGFRVL